MSIRGSQNKNAMQSNWQALRYLALCHLKDLHRRNPQWSAHDAIREMALPPTELIIRMTVESGFTLNATDQTFRRQAESKPESVEGYGLSSFGKGLYGSRREYSDGRKQVIRKVTKLGQFSYRGRLYYLGIEFRNTTVFIQEIDESILVFISGQPLIRLSRRT